MGWARRTTTNKPTMILGCLVIRRHPNFLFIPMPAITRPTAANNGIVTKAGSAYRSAFFAKTEMTAKYPAL